MHAYFALVTGGAGFIGSNLVRELVGRGWRVRVLDNFSTGRRENLDAFQPHAIDVVHGDVRVASDCQRACRNVDVVFHQAALRSVPRSIDDPAASNEVNVTGTLNVLCAAGDAGVRRLVFASSSSVYGDSPQLPQDEEQAPCPVSPYAVSKLAGEHYCVAFARLHALETVALRYFNVFGPGQDPESKYSAVIPAFLAQIARGEPLEIHGDGLQARDFTYVGDVVRANLLAAAVPDCSGQVFNIAGGQSRTVLDVANAVVAASGAADPGRRHAPTRAGDVRVTCASIGKAGRLLGYRPGLPFEQAMERTVGYFRQRFGLPASVPAGAMSRRETHPIVRAEPRPEAGLGARVAANGGA